MTFFDFFFPLFWFLFFGINDDNSIKKVYKRGASFWLLVFLNDICPMMYPFSSSGI